MKKINPLLCSGPFLGLNDESGSSDWAAPITRFDWKPEQPFFGVGDLDSVAASTNGVMWDGVRSAFQESDCTVVNGKGFWFLNTIANAKTWRIQGTVTTDDLSFSFDESINTGATLRVDVSDSGTTTTAGGSAKTVREWQESPVNVFSLNYFYETGSGVDLLEGSAQFSLTSHVRLSQPFNSLTPLTKAIWRPNLSGLVNGSDSLSGGFGFFGSDTPSAISGCEFMGRTLQGQVDSGLTITLSITVTDHYDETDWD